MPAAKNVIDVLDERGFIAQVSDSDGLRDHLEVPMTCYIGFDPTADSLHIGSLVPIMALVHMQRHGHRPVVLVGGGTGLVGDPSGKTEMRQLLTLDQIQYNANALQKQLSCFLSFLDDKALLLNNADWLVDLHYIDFLRDIGQHFSVNRMLAMESYKIRLETGLNFIEFNYMLLQAYDFYYLARNHDCFVQMGGSDQWGNILAGVDLIRRKMGKTAYGLTFPLITTASGAKMGKTAAGAVWLSAEKTSPFDFYQYWVNTEDHDVARFLALYTLLPMHEIQEIKKLEGRDLNLCKTVLAYEVCSLAHGEVQALAAYEAASGIFGQRIVPPDLLPSSTIPRKLEGQAEQNVPTTFVEEATLRAGVPAIELFVKSGLCSSKSAARRLVQQGGAYVNQERVRDFDHVINLGYVTQEGILLKAGKKKVHRVQIAK